jgi:hypothetical protein
LNESAFEQVSNLYMCVPENLKLVMNLMRSKHRNIQNESFSIFCSFVQDLPNRPKGIQDIILMNREKLIKYIDDNEVGILSGNEKVTEMLLSKRSSITKMIRTFIPQTTDDNNASL